MVNVKLKDEGQDLFPKIEIDIKKNPDKYREAGEWLDSYYDVKSFWKRIKEDLKKVLDTEKFVQPFVKKDSETQKEKEYLWLMIQFKQYFETRDLNGKLKDVDKICTGIFTETSKNKPAKWGKATIDDLRSRLDERQKEGYELPIRPRFERAICDFRIKNEDLKLLSAEEARRVCLLTWLITASYSSWATLLGKGLSSFSFAMAVCSAS